MPRQTIELRIRRQDRPGAPPRWEEFSLPYRPNQNVISCLMSIQRNPVAKDGKKTVPVVWEQNCLEEICGSCTILIDGRPRQACSALIDSLPEKTITLAPLTKFPIVRDLMVDRQRMFDALRKVRAWIPIDGTYNLGPGPRLSETERATAYEFARCMTCGCCMEACPQYAPTSAFIGPAPLGQVLLFNLHPTGKNNSHDRLEAIMGKGGITDCGNAQNCVKVCPKNIPLTDAIAELGRQTTIHWLKGLLGR